MVIFATIFVQEQNCFEKAAAQCLPRLHGKAATGGAAWIWNLLWNPAR